MPRGSTDVRPATIIETAADPNRFGGGVNAILVSPQMLAAELGSEHPPVLLDVRWNLGGPPGLDEYRLGHLQGARFVDLDVDLAAAPARGRGRHPLPEAKVFEAAMRRCGVNDDSAVVVYDAGGGLSAARAWWLLRHAGHDDVRLLDGGVAAWTAAALPLTTTEPSGAAGAMMVRPGAMPVLDATSAAALARAGVLLDARAGDRYRGEAEPVDPVAGHIPGARSAPTAANLGGAGTFLSGATLRDRFESMGAGEGVAVGAYCGSGVTAAHEVLALALAGIPAALYPGSWSEWISDPSRPVAAGPERG
jgi:thiosulfate/3-mercaptopyruvate sulfurtransferase